MNTIRTIGLVTGGGDAPGLNAVIRAVVKTAVTEYSLRVIGIEDSFEGLLGETRARLVAAYVWSLSNASATDTGAPK